MSGYRHTTPTPPVTLQGLELVATVQRLRQCFVHEHVRLLQAHGDWIHFGWPLQQHLCFHPMAVRHVLADGANLYKKSKNYDGLRPAMGNGLLTSEGERWRTSRRLVAPEFSREAVRGGAPLLVEHATALLDAWAVQAKQGGVVDVAPDMAQLFFGVVSRLFFGEGISEHAAFVYQALGVWESRFVRRVYSIVKLPDDWATPETKRMQAGIAEVDRIIEGLIARAEENPPLRPNILSRLLELRRKEPEAFSNRQLRDELMTLLLAGYDTTAVAMTWTLHLMATHTSVQEDVRSEVQAVLRGAQPTAADVEKLPLVGRVLEESLRLYPPAPGISREALQDDEVTGVPIAAGTKIELSAYATHRHPAFWDDPSRFDPGRFEPEQRGRIDPFSYFPFGRGPRMCAGKELANLEMPLVLSMILQRFRVCAVVEGEPDPFAGITLRPRHGLPLRLLPV